MKIFAVIPTGNREKEYLSVIDWCTKNGVIPVTIATSSEALEYSKGFTLRSYKLNISHWWNLGIDFATNNKADIIAILNDDVVLPDDWLKTMRDALAGHSGASGERGVGKITGYAFMIDPKDKIRADNNLAWWYGDDDIQRQCELKRGFNIVRGYDVPNLYANTSYEKFKEQINKDADYYATKWAI